MLKNAYSLAKIGADTAENERNFAEILTKIGNYPTGPLPWAEEALGVRYEERGGLARCVADDERYHGGST